MKAFTIILTIFFFASHGNSQKLKSINSIELNSKFTLQLEKDNSGTISYNIISIESFNEELKMSSANNFLEKDIEHNQIQGILAMGMFGSNKSTLLVMNSGFENPLQYKLMIDIKGRGRYKKTSTALLEPGIPSTEIWPYKIHSIKIALFEEFEYDFVEIIEPNIDSTCIKKPELSVNYGEKLFKQHLKKVINGLTKKPKFDLKSMISFEDSIKSEDISLGHYYSLGEGIYPFFKNYEFGNPIQFRRVECPYFDGHSSYFYTKNENNIKVAGYEWKEFKLSDWPIERIESKELRNAFELKYQSIKEIVSTFLGEPNRITQESNSGRMDTKWKSKEGINAYLFIFDNYNQISLYVYYD